MISAWCILICDSIGIVSLCLKMEEFIKIYVNATNKLNTTQLIQIEEFCLLLRSKFDASNKLWIEEMEKITTIINDGILHYIDDIDTKYYFISELCKWLVNGLNINNAKLQKDYSSRHLKAGLKLAKALCQLTNLELDFLIEINLPSLIFKIIQEEHTGLSIRLMALNVLNNFIRTKSTMEFFIEQDGYSFLIEQMEKVAITRYRYNITCIIEKIHYVHTIKSVVNEKTCSKLQYLLEEIISGYKSSELLSLNQTEKLLPMKLQFKLNEKQSSITKEYLDFYEEYNLLKIISLIISSSTLNKNLFILSVEFIKIISNDEHGLKYLIKNMEYTKLIIQYISTKERKSSKYAINLSDSLNLLITTANIMEEIKLENNCCKSLENLHSLRHNLHKKLLITKVFTYDDYINIIINIIKNCNSCKEYAIDILIDIITINQELTIIDKYGKIISELNIEYLQPWIENIDIISNSSIENLMTICKNSPDDFSPLFINCLRQLYKIIIPLECDEDVLNYIDADKLEKLFEFYSLDGISFIINILTKINDIQSNQNHLLQFELISIIKILLRLLYLLLLTITTSQDSDFKDLTPVTPLLLTYSVLYNISSASPGYDDVRNSKTLIIQSLSLYMRHEPKEDINNSLWTKMLTEVFHHITMYPRNITPGLELLCALLPELSHKGLAVMNSLHLNRMQNLYRLWNIHLYSISLLIYETIEILTCTNNKLNYSLLIKVCCKIADLSKNCAILISKSILEPIIKEGTEESVYGRRIVFLDNIINYPSIKLAILYTLQTDCGVDIMAKFHKILLNCDNIIRYHILNIYGKLLAKDIARIGKFPGEACEKLVITISSSVSKLLSEIDSKNTLIIKQAILILHQVTKSNNGLLLMKRTLNEANNPFIHIFNNDDITPLILKFLIHYFHGESINLISKIIGWPINLQSLQQPVLQMATNRYGNILINKLNSMVSSTNSQINDLEQFSATPKDSKTFEELFIQRFELNKYKSIFNVLDNLKYNKLYFYEVSYNVSIEMENNIKEVMSELNETTTAEVKNQKTTLYSETDVLRNYSSPRLFPRHYISRRLSTHVDKFVDSPHNEQGPSTLAQCSGFIGNLKRKRSKRAGPNNKFRRSQATGLHGTLPVRGRSIGRQRGKSVMVRRHFLQQK